MGDWAQCIVDVEVRGNDAVEAEARLTAWLIERGVISDTKTDCVLGAPLGHPPGPNYGYAVGHSGRAPELWTNGVEVRLGRSVYYTLDLEGVTCPRCGHHEALLDGGGRWHSAFSDTIGEWLDGGTGLVDCVHCHAVHELNDWDWGAYPFAFGELGLRFWNWEPLSDQFVADVSHVLGHRVVCNDHKL